jgi:hypothetical protein
MADHHRPRKRSFQRTGVGTTLLQFAEIEARRLRYNSIHPSTHEKMTENQCLCSKIGWREYAQLLKDGYSRIYIRKGLV